MSAHTPLRSLCFLLPLAALAVIPLIAGEAGQLVGKVTDEQGTPIAGARITLIGTRAAGVLVATSDSEGRYRLHALDAILPVDVLVEAEGMVAVEMRGVRIRTDRLTRLDVRLHSVGSQDVLVLVDPRVTWHRLALEGARSAIREPFRLVEVTSESTWRADLLRSLQNPPSAVLAVGEEAAWAARIYARKVPVVHVMVPDPLSFEMATDNMCGVPLIAGLDEAMARLREADSRSVRVGVVYDPSRLSAAIGRLRRAAAAVGSTLVTGPAHRPEDVPRALADLAGEDLDALMILADPVLWTPANIGLAHRFVEEGDQTLVVPDASLAGGGRSVVYGAGFHESGVVAGKIVKDILEGRLHPHDVGLAEAGPPSP